MATFKQLQISWFKSLEIIHEWMSVHIFCGLISTVLKVSTFFVSKRKSRVILRRHLWLGILQYFKDCNSLLIGNLLTHLICMFLKQFSLWRSSHKVIFISIGIPCWLFLMCKTCVLWNVDVLLKLLHYNFQKVQMYMWALSSAIVLMFQNVTFQFC